MTPQRVALDERATYLAAGSFHTCAIGESGTIFCWGRNSAGQLGTGNAEPSTVPVRASMEPFAGVVVESIALGEAHSCATARDDFGGSSLLCWGSGESGQTGPLGSSAVPIVVSTDAGQVTAGAFHTCFVSASSATASCMGENTQLQCGVPGPNNISNPETPEGLEPIVDRVRAGRGNHTCAIEKSDFIHCWGENDSGQLGVFASEAATPAETTAFELLGGLVDVQAGFAHTCALAGSEVWCWGLNESGQLGTPGPSRPDPVMVLPMTGIIAIGVGTIHTCAMRSATEIYCWGGNAFGQLGNGTDVDSNSPVAVTLP
ncbi:MAG: hypothetical protein HOW73_35540 [Polyangiaceae bacterium]|nr:hypothetical protein [Polyangiaceae bacterium]